MTIVRCWDWEKRWHAFLGETRNRPFAFGEQDCALWALRAIDAMCDTAFATPLRGTYDSLDGARAVCAACGWTTLIDGCAELFGAPLASVLLAQRGDVIVIPPRAEDPLGVALIQGGDAVYGAAATGVQAFPHRVFRLLPGVVAYAMGRPS